MQDAQDLAMKNYQENMTFFEKEHNHLYTKLMALDAILADGSYSQKYDLEFKDDYFDVVELSSGAFLYNQDSDKHAQNLCDDISYKKNEHVFDTYRKLNYEASALEYLKQQDSFTIMSTTAAIKDYYYKNTDDSMSMLEIDKFIFLGAGLGFHIDKIVSKFDVQIVLIIENDIELFRLSLFTTNYKDVLKNAISFFSIAETRNELNNAFNSFYLKAFIHNQYIKFSVFSSGYEEKIQEIQSLLLTRPEATYSQERLLMKNKRVTDKIIQKYQFFNILAKPEEDFFDDKPILVLGAGPSLHNNIEWLQKNKNKFVTIAPLVALKALKKANISPDILVQVDENIETTAAVFSHLGDIDFLKNTLCFFSASVSDEMFIRFDKKNIYLHEDRTKYKLKTSTNTVASVGESMYTLALSFNAANIYLLGIDLALGDDGQSHSSDHFMAKKIKETNTGFQLENIIMQVKGNLREEVGSTPVLSISIPIINDKTRAYKRETQTIYNLSDGAYFEQTIAKHPHEVEIEVSLDKVKLHKELLKVFDKYSTPELNEAQMGALIYRRKHLNDIKLSIREFKEKPYANKEIFIHNFVNLLSKVLNSRYENELQEILLIFCLGIASFIYDLLNTRELQNSKKHVKFLRKNIIEQFEKIIKAYEDAFVKLEEMK